LTGPFNVETSTRDGFSVVAPEGHVDAHTAPRFEKAIEAEVAAGRRRIVVDCSRMTYISSAGLGVFMSFIEDLRAQGGDLKICGVIPKVQATFEIVGFSEIFDILPDVDAAVRRFREAKIRKD
jgi:anti-sigma B factor antagonist